MKNLLIASLSIFLVAAAQSCGSPVEAQSQAGPPGPQGPPGVSGYQIVTLFQTLLNGTTTPIVITCPASKAVLSGGFIVDNPSISVIQSFPQTKTDWKFLIRNSTGGDAPISVYAVCATA
jgi:hypothetical protein